MNRTVRAFGWAWLIGPLALLGVTIWLDLHSPFLGFGYYFVMWSAPILLALCGAWFLGGMPGAGWVLRFAAVLVAIYAIA